MIRSSLVRQSRRSYHQLSSLPSLSTKRSHFPPIRLPLRHSNIRALQPYSTATESTSSNISSESPPPGTTSTNNTQSSEGDPAKQASEAKDREIIDLKVWRILQQWNKNSKDSSAHTLQDKYLRSVADFRNLQDRTQRDVKQARQFAITGFARDLIESVDNLDRALSTVNPDSLSPATSGSTADAGAEAEKDGNSKLHDLYQGLKMTDGILMQTLKKHGLERFDPKGERFDPQFHDAAFQTKMDGKEDGTVFETIQKGFSLNGRVVRVSGGKPYPCFASSCV